MNDELQLQLLQGWFLEHEARAREYAFTLPLNHKKRIQLQKDTNQLRDDINKIRARMKEEKGEKKKKGNKWDIN